VVSAGYPITAEAACKLLDHMASWSSEYTRFFGANMSLSKVASNPWRTKNTFSDCCQIKNCSESTVNYTDKEEQAQYAFFIVSNWAQKHFDANALMVAEAAKAGKPPAFEAVRGPALAKALEALGDSYAHRVEALSRIFVHCATKNTLPDAALLGKAGPEAAALFGPAYNVREAPLPPAEAPMRYAVFAIARPYLEARFKEYLGDRAFMDCTSPTTDKPFVDWADSRVKERKEAASKEAARLAAKTEAREKTERETKAAQDQLKTLTADPNALPLPDARMADVAPAPAPAAAGAKRKEPEVPAPKPAPTKPTPKAPAPKAPAPPADAPAPPPPAAATTKPAKPSKADAKPTPAPTKSKVKPAPRSADEVWAAGGDDSSEELNRGL
jgi:hypothetical protein